MLLHTTATTKLQLITTGTGYNLHVAGNYVDRPATGVDTYGQIQATISTATTTDLISAPSGGTTRNVRHLYIRNAGSSPASGVILRRTDGTTNVDFAIFDVAQNGMVQMNDDGIISQSRLTFTLPWFSTLLGVPGVDPGYLMDQLQRASNIAATPTNISTSVARCCLFIPPANITVNRIRWYGVGATTNVFRVALYRLSDLARLTNELAFTTVANTWGSVDAGGVALTAGVPYFLACSVNATGTTAGPACFGTTIAATTGRIQTTPESLPGNLSSGSGYCDTYMFQFAVTTGALPNPAATLAAQAAWTGGMPAFFLDSNTAA